MGPVLMMLFGGVLIGAAILLYGIDPHRDAFVLFAFAPAGVAAFSVAYALIQCPNWRAGYTKSLLLVVGISGVLRVIFAGSGTVDAYIGAVILLIAAGFPIGVLMDWLALARWAARSRREYGRPPPRPRHSGVSAPPKRSWLG